MILKADNNSRHFAAGAIECSQVGEIACSPAANSLLCASRAGGCTVRLLRRNVFLFVVITFSQDFLSALVFLSFSSPITPIFFCSFFSIIAERLSFEPAITKVVTEKFEFLQIPFKFGLRTTTSCTHTLLSCLRMCGALGQSDAQRERAWWCQQQVG